MTEQNTPRGINIVVGLWLILSAFSWVHSGPQQMNALVVGAACAAAAVAALRVPAARFVNLGLAIWLFVSTWIFSVSSPSTVWNNVLAAFVMLIVSLVPSRRETAFRH